MVTGLITQSQIWDNARFFRGLAQRSSLNQDFPQFLAVQHVEATCFHMVRFMSFPSSRPPFRADGPWAKTKENWAVAAKPLAGLIISSGIILPFYISLYTGDYSITIQERGIPFLTNHWLQNILQQLFKRDFPTCRSPRQLSINPFWYLQHEHLAQTAWWHGCPPLDFIKVAKPFASSRQW